VIGRSVIENQNPTVGRSNNIASKRSLEKAKDVVMFKGTTIENLLRSVERAELHALQQTWEEKEFDGSKYVVYRTNSQQMMIEVA
jgi:hypothetical protein